MRHPAATAAIPEMPAGSDNGDAGSGDDSTGGWIDPGSGSMDDLSDNLQQIVRLLGQMTDVFTSDAVIEDMQNVFPSRERLFGDHEHGVQSRQCLGSA